MTTSKEEKEEPTKSFAGYGTPSGYPSALTILDDEAYDNGFQPKPLMELNILAMEACIREKPNWWTKVHDEAIVQKWRGEILEQQRDSIPDNRDKSYLVQQIDYAVAECQWLATQYAAGPVRPAAVDGVYCRDDLGATLQETLLQGVARLRAQPAIGAEQEDRHPGTPQMVDLVHPSLYAYERGKTHVLPHDDGGTAHATSMPEWSTFLGREGVVEDSMPPPDNKTRHYMDVTHSKAGLQWLPAEFWVNADATHCEIRSYINNLHPETEAPLYESLAQLFCHAVPALEAVLSEAGEHVGLMTPYDKDRRQDATVRERASRLPHGCDWWEESEPREQNEGESDEDYDEYVDNFYESGRVFCPPYIPEFEGATSVQYNKPRANVSLRNRPLQVICKIASLEIEPGTYYGGGAWHVEGTLEERIVATACYYLECDNVETGQLHFRNSVCEPEYEQSDDRGVGEMYGLANEEALVQDLGSCQTVAGRLLAWPNTLHHCVSKLELLDEAKPGKRTIVCFFLVDPTLRIRSTATVPPQQLAWVSEQAKATLLSSSTAIVEEALLHQMTHTHLESSTLLTYEAACERRDRLMNERQQTVRGDNGEPFFERTFSLCEH